MKKTTLEKRAENFSNYLIQNATPGNPIAITVVWKKSRTWGSIPSIEYHGEVIARASGCGYDKLSAVVATALADLAPDVMRYAGVGISSLQRHLDAHGWTLAHIVEEKGIDVFLIQRKPLTMADVDPTAGMGDEGVR